VRLPKITRRIRRPDDDAFRLSDPAEFWLLVGPVLAYAAPYVLLRTARAALGRDGGDAFINRWMIPEIGPIEIPTFLLLAWAAGWAIRIAVARREQLGRLVSPCLALFGAGLLLVAGEEASWGQWFFGFQPPPKIAEINHQGELNVHNIVLQGKTEVMRAMFGLFGLSVVFVAPRIPALASAGAPRILAPWFALMTILPIWELVTDYVTLMPRIDGFMRSKLYSESQELIIAASAVVYVALVARRHDSGVR
jgi:hypothetical protein